MKAPVVLEQRAKSGSRVVRSRGVVIERVDPGAYFTKAVCVGHQRVITGSRVFVAIPIRIERIGYEAVLPEPVVLSASTPAPEPVFCSPVVRLRSTQVPLAVTSGGWLPYANETTADSAVL